MTRCGEPQNESEAEVSDGSLQDDASSKPLIFRDDRYPRKRSPTISGPCRRPRNSHYAAASDLPRAIRDYASDNDHPQSQASDGFACLEILF